MIVPILAMFSLRDHFFDHNFLSIFKCILVKVMSNTFFNGSMSNFYKKNVITCLQQ